MENLILVAEEREKESSKGKVKSLRGLGLTPGIVYDKGNSILIQVPTKDLINIIKKDGQSAIFDLSYNGKEDQVFIKELQKDPVTYEILHIDLQPIAMNETMKVNVPIHIEGQRKVESMGGIIQRQLREIEIEAFPRNIPKVIEVDVSDLNIGDHLLVEDLQIAGEITVLSNPQEVILLISEPSMEEVEEVDEVDEVDETEKDETVEVDSKEE